MHCGVKFQASKAKTPRVEGSEASWDFRPLHPNHFTSDFRVPMVTSLQSQFRLWSPKLQDDPAPVW